MVGECDLAIELIDVAIFPGMAVQVALFASTGILVVLLGYEIRQLWQVEA